MVPAATTGGKTMKANKSPSAAGIRGRGRPQMIHPGDRYGLLTVLARVEDGARRAPRYLCRCDCGCEVEVFGVALRSGSTKSCGCLRRERMRAAAKAAREAAKFLGGDDHESHDCT